MSKKDTIRICLAELPEDEGIKSRPYDDHLGYKTIGVGFNIDKRNKDREGNPIILHPDLAKYISGEKYFMEIPEARRILRDILEREYHKCAAVFLDWRWERMTAGQRASLLNMFYQLGYDKFTGFVKMIDAVNHGDWETAQKEARDSLWFKQTQESRTTRVIDGLFPHWLPS